MEFLDLGPKVVGLKMGSQGAIVATSEKKWHFEPLPVEVIDTTGAGDAFDGAFITAYLRDLSLEECGRFANAAAALTTTGWGAVGPIPTLKMVERYLSPA
jgi:2-dehydro-3-deoxygluconokinase